VFENSSEGKQSGGKPIKRWIEDVEKNVKKMGVRCWRKNS
jgi:hypothetical protein